MTDCYICRHPILEGQRQGVEKELLETDMTFKSQTFREHPIHRNVQDCLPTLDTPLHQDYAMALKRDVCIMERERAAKLVDSFNHVPNSHDNWYVDDEVVCGFMNAMRILAAKIRGEE